jgi:zinc protease
MAKAFVLSVVSVLCVLSAPVRATPLAVSETTLANGLRVVVHENHSAPVATIEVWYKVGSYYEHSGSTGMSHLLEHMMFKGSKGYPDGRYDALIEAAGGDENAFTSDNYTVFWAELAADRYELELKLEADRMVNLSLDSTEFSRERNVVMEERRLGENEPYDDLYEKFCATAYLIHPFRNPIVGWMDDLERLTRADLFAHYRRYYNPSNAVLVVAGDVQSDRVFAQAARWFGKYPKASIPIWSPVEPPQNGERWFTVRRDVTTPAMMIGYHVPGSADPDYYAFEVLESILLRGKSSRLYSELVYRKGEALQVSGGNDTEKDPGLFYFFVLARSPDLMDSVESGIYAELETLKSVPVTDSELTQVKNQVVANFVFGQERNQGMAQLLGRSYTLYGSADFARQYPERIAAVSRDDIMRTARKYFIADNRTVGKLLASPEPESEQKK